MAVIAVVGIVALILAIKVAHLISRLILGLIALAAISSAVWWFFLRACRGVWTVLHLIPRVDGQRDKPWPAGPGVGLGRVCQV